WEHEPFGNISCLNSYQPKLAFYSRNDSDGCIGNISSTLIWFNLWCIKWNSDWIYKNTCYVGNNRYHVVLYWCWYGNYRRTRSGRLSRNFYVVWKFSIFRITNSSPYYVYYFCL